MKNYIKKSIAFAFPNSPLANKEGFKETGCYYIESTLCNIEGSGQCNSSPDYQVGFFANVTQDLIDSFHEAEGAPCQHSLKHNASFYTL
jgi:hypothetical protein